jgi:hypothetical protein
MLGYQQKGRGRGESIPSALSPGFSHTLRGGGDSVRTISQTQSWRVRGRGIFWCVYTNYSTKVTILNSIYMYLVSFSVEKQLIWSNLISLKREREQNCWAGINFCNFL